MTNIQKLRLEKRQLYSYAMISITATLPFYMLFNNIALILASVSALLIFDKKRLFYALSSSRTTIIFAVLFTFLTLSTIYSENLRYAGNVISRTSLFVVIPFIILSGYSFLDTKMLRKILNVFVISSFVATIVCLITATKNTIEYASVNPFNETNGNFFSYIKLTSALRYHPIYFGCLIILSLSISILRFLEDRDLRTHKLFFGFLVIYFGIFILLINSFMLFFVLIAIIAISILFAYRSNLITGKTLMISIIMLIVPFYFSSHFLNQKLNGINIREDLTTRDFSGESFTAVKARVAKFYCSVEVIRDNPILGVGIGDGPDVLVSYYLKNNFYHGYERGYNSHNQFLTTFIYIGVFGFLCLCVLVLNLFVTAFRNRSYLLLVFIITCTLFFMTESVLERQTGIVFFCFFGVLLSVADRNSSIFTPPKKLQE